MDDDVRMEGCSFVFDQPYRKYRVPYSSTQYVRISFARAESLLMRRSPAVLRAAYMISKEICCYEEWYSSYVTSYVLKMAALWSMQMPPAITENDDRDFSETQLQRQVEQLFAQLYEFTAQDYVPGYFIPSFHFPVKKSQLFVNGFVNGSQAFLRSLRMSYEKLFQVKDNDDYEYQKIKRSLVYSYIMYASVADAGSFVKWKWPQIT